MRYVNKSRVYRRDFQRECAGIYRLVLATELPNVIAMLAADHPLPDKYRDHALTGNWAGMRECHLKPDLLLVYVKIDGVRFENKSGELRLMRLGSHSEIFG
jgi:mRNA interferase YafQ